LGRLPPSDINRFVCLPIFDPRHPSAQGTSAPSETHLPAMLLASWEFHPSEDRSEPLSFVATVLSRSTLGLNGSIIIASACHRLRCRLPAPSESMDTIDNSFSLLIVVCESMQLAGFQPTAEGT